MFRVPTVSCVDIYSLFYTRLTAPHADGQVLYLRPIRPSTYMAAVNLKQIRHYTEVCYCSDDPSFSKVWCRLKMFHGVLTSSGCFFLSAVEDERDGRELYSVQTMPISVSAVEGFSRRFTIHEVYSVAKTRQLVTFSNVIVYFSFRFV